ncbi:type IV pilus modification PilV family protein [Massilia endophytica]|uniref:type IV pilus modification PilV family protein n=1 Tax=Massilia endophytica TaxID=2899220 RepID=UPI001E526509|nr:prepilin-type N-terminal cleavage/methylation domain-containing protein [Massilia endophytica]UGQ48372.1 prepilin-type N-terminal cleavage/methylation domain-containing protein [Massilia endophytica]
MWIKPQKGTTLVELIIAITILSVGIGGILVVYNTTTRNSANPVIQKQMVAVAEGMMEEIQRMPFAVSANTAPVGCARDTYNDVRDYNGYSSANACDINGNVRLANYAVAVTVVSGASTSFPSIPAADLLSITVTVSSGGSSVSLAGWRTNYAQLIP